MPAVDPPSGLQKVRGRLWPLGWWHILREFRRTEWININGLGLLPAYQGLGGSVLLYAALFQALSGEQFRHADLAQVAETNFKSMQDMAALNFDWYKRHRIYHPARKFLSAD